MATQTTNLGLTLPIGTERVSRQVINANMELIDSAIGAVPEGENLQEEIEYVQEHVADLIDDTAGAGDDDKVWSADKTALELDKKANAIEMKIASPAAVMTFPDGADNQAMALEIPLEPVQDLHGYDYPWPAGGGKNLLDPSEYERGTIASDGSIDYRANRATTGFIPITGGNTYYFSVHETGWYFAGCRSYNSNKEPIESSNILDRVITTDNNAAYIRGILRRSDGANFVLTDIPNTQCELGSTATDYAPYTNICPISGWTKAEISVANGDDPTAQGYYVDEYEITFPSEAGTVYGGTLTVNKDGTGVLTVARKQVKIKDLSWVYSAEGGGRFTCGTLSDIYQMAARYMDIKSSCFETVSDGRGLSSVPDHSIYNGSSTIYIKDSIAASGSESYPTHLVSLYGDEQIVYLINPVTYQLSAPIICSLLGLNNIWADTGNINSVEYSADTKMYIDHLNDPTEDDFIANNNIAANEYFAIGNDLYRATQSIPANDPIIPDTNCENLSLPEILNSFMTGSGVSF